MSTVATYLIFPGHTEEAFEFYKSVFGTDYAGPVMRMGDAPPQPGMPELSDADKQAVMHVTLPILGGHLLMGSDTVGSDVNVGDNVHVMLSPDTREEADEIFAKLSDGGSDLNPPKVEFWGDYYGSCCDRFGVRWMIDVAGEQI